MSGSDSPPPGACSRPVGPRSGDFLGPNIRDFYRRYPEGRLLELWWDAGVRDVRPRRLSLGGGIVTWGRRS